MKIEKFEITGPLLICPNVHSDFRGFFMERFRANWMLDLGILPKIEQLNFSFSEPKVLRGLHYQYDKPQGKLVTVTRGRVFDVAVDIRKNSPTFGKHISVELSGKNPTWFWIPPGFAHGFLVIGDEPADVMYMVDQPYNASGEGAIVWNDPDLSIQWPLMSNLVISPKDQAADSFRDYSMAAQFN